MSQPTFAEEVGRGCRELLPYALNLTRKSHTTEAADLVHMTVCKALAMQRHYDPSLDIMPWLSRAMRNQMWDRYRSDSRVVLVPMELAPEQHVAASQETTAALRQQLRRWYNFFAQGKFPDKARAIFLLSVLYGYSHGEIAKLGNIPLGTVKSTIRRVWETYRAEHHQPKGSAA